MQRSKKIALYLKKNPQATEKDLQRKFDVGFREARVLLHTEEIFAPKRSWWTRGIPFLSAWWANERLVLLTLLGIALMVRGAYASFIFRNPLLITSLHDAAYYVEWAKRLVSDGFIGDKIFFTEPFYAYFLAVFLKLFGAFGTEAVRVFQFLLGAALPLVLYILAKKLFNRSAALATGLLAALYGPFIFYEGLLLKTSLEVFLVPGFILLTLHAFQKRDAFLFAWAGVYVGILSLVKGNNLIFWPVVVVLIFFLGRDLVVKRRAMLSGLFSLGVLLCILPVTIRNYVVGHDIVLTNYSFGLAVYQGNWWNGDGSTANVPRFLRPDPRYEENDAVGMAEAYAGHLLKPSEVSRFWLGKALSESVADPLHFFGTLGNKLLLIVNHKEMSDNYQLDFYRTSVPLLWFLPNFWLVMLLALCGMVFFFRQDFWRRVSAEVPSHTKHFPERAIIFLTLFFSAITVLLITTVNARYRVPLLPFLLLLSGGALSYVWSLWQDREVASIARLWIFLGIFLLVTGYPLPSLAHDTRADAYHALGYFALEHGDYGQAKDLFEKTIALDKTYAWAYGNLWLTSLILGDYDTATQALKTLIVLRPDDLKNYERLALHRQLKNSSSGEWQKAARDFLAQTKMPTYDADFNEAERLLKHQNNQQAEELFNLSLREYDNPPATLIALATLKKQQGVLFDAQNYLQQVVNMSPENFLARYNLANVSIEEKNYYPVVVMLKDIYEFTPELGNTWYNYAVALIKTNKNAEAAYVIQAYIERYKDDPNRKDIVDKFRSALSQASNQNDIQNLIKKAQP